MHFEAVENLTNSTIEDDLGTAHESYYLAYEITAAILYLFGACLDAGIIYTMLRYKKMHTVPNKLIANWSIADLCVLVALPFIYRLDVMSDELGLPLKVLSFLTELELNFRNAEMLFLFAVAIDWCLVSYFSKASQKFRKYYKYTIGIIWVSALLSICVGLGLTLNELYFHVPLLLWFFGYIALFILIIVFQSVRAVQACRKRSSVSPTLMLTLITVLVVCWFPLWSAVLLEELPLLVELSVLSASVVTFIALYCCNQDFHACFRQMLKCSNNGYLDDITEFQSVSENLNKDGSRTQVHQNGHGENK